jgi:hypothetical protein
MISTPEDLAALLNTVMSLKLNFDNTTTHAPLNALTGSVSEDIYYMADISSDNAINNTKTTYIVRMNQFNNIIWSRLYDYEAKEEFAISPNEEFLFGTAVEDYPAFIQFDTIDGTIIRLVSVNILANSTTSKLVVSPGNSVLFISLKSLSGDSSQL